MIPWTKIARCRRHSARTHVGVCAGARRPIWRLGAVFSTSVPPRSIVLFREQACPKATHVSTSAALLNGSALRTRMLRGPPGADFAHNQPMHTHTHHLQDHDCMCMKKTPPRALPTPAKRDFCCVSVESVAHGWCVGSARPLCLHGCVNLERKASRNYARAPCADILEHQGWPRNRCQNSQRCVSRPAAPSSTQPKRTLSATGSPPVRPPGSAVAGHGTSKRWQLADVHEGLRGPGRRHKLDT